MTLINVVVRTSTGLHVDLDTVDNYLCCKWQKNINKKGYYI